MFDIWGFLLQTLTASGVAALLLVIKALFKDKLPPKWHFAVWGVLGIMILIPAGFNGRYTLFHWQLVVEVIKSWVGDYSFTQVLFPIPVLTAIPETIVQWIFAGYILGVVVHVINYLASYLRLRLVLRNGTAPNDELIARIQQIAAEQKVTVGRVIAVSGLPSAFVCGIIRPVLVVPADSDLDDKVILHELLHMRYRDTFWSVVICFLRCLHWCNPLIIYCANQAIHDMEARCDQHVLEQLEGEERRDYGRILLSMANDRFAKTPGSTCINNGGKNIRERIETIARFKKYPVGMGLVSVCIMILLTLSLVVGVQASAVYDSSNSIRLSFASARSTPCTTAAGAFDTYGKAILDRNGIYRAMCAPDSMQAEILNEMLEKDKTGIFPNWDCGLNGWPDAQSGYYIYNLKQCDKNTYEGLFVVKLNYPPDGKAEEVNMMYLAVQNLRVKKQNGRWVAIPLEDFRHIETWDQNLTWGCIGLPGITYAGVSNDFRTEVTFQTIHVVDSTVTQQNDLWFLSNSYYDTTPKPNAEFSSAYRSNNINCIYVGSDDKKDLITQIGFSVAPVYEGEKRPEQLQYPNADNSKPIGNTMSGGSNAGEQWGSTELSPGWDSTIPMNGGGSSFDPARATQFPEYYAADLYINHEKVAEFDLTLQKGEAE